MSHLLVKVGRVYSPGILNVAKGVYSNDIWHADHDFRYQIGDADYPDFFDFLAKVALNVWDEEEEIEQEDEGEG
jgi:hypothetical protein